MSSHPRAIVHGLALAFALVSVAGAGALVGEAPSPWLLLCGATIVFFGAGFPLLLRWSPVEPSPLKLCLLASLLSPCVFALLFVATESVFGGSMAGPCAFLAVAFLQLLAWGRVLGSAPLGRAAWATVALALVCAGFLAWMSFGLGSGSRLGHEGGLWHLGVVQMMERGPWENPWLAGTGLSTHPGYDVLGRVVGQALGLSAPSAFALIAVWSLATVPLSVYLIAAPLWSEERRVVLAPWLALFGWNALAGLAGGRPSEDLPWRAALAEVTPWTGGGEVLFGFAAFFRPSPTAPALALAAGAWLCAAHALRHGRRPWVGLTALLHATTFLVEPTIGVAAAAATLLAALLAASGEARSGIALGVIAGCLPGLWLTRIYGLACEPVLAPPAGWPGAGALLVPAVVCVVAACGVLFSGGRLPDTGDRRTLLALLMLAISVPIAIGFAWPAAAPSRAALFRLASLPLGVLAAGGLVTLAQRGSWTRWIALAIGAVFTVGGARAVVLAFGLHLQLAREPIPAQEQGGRLEAAFLDEAQAPGDGLLPETVIATAAQRANAAAVRLRHRALAYRWLAEDPDGQLAALGERPVLVVRAGARLPDGPVAPSAAALYADLPQWVDRWPEVAPKSDRWAPRYDRVRALLSAPLDWDPLLMNELESLGRPAVFVVEEKDREQTHPRGAWTPFRGVDDRLLRLQAKRVHVEGTVAIYFWQPTDSRE